VDVGLERVFLLLRKTTSYRKDRGSQPKLGGKTKRIHQPKKKAAEGTATQSEGDKTRPLRSSGSKEPKQPSRFGEPKKPQAKDHH